MKPRYFFTGDHRFWHKNIIEYEDRPFLDANGEPDVVSMNQQLIETWNANITENDVVCYLGNLSFGGYNKTLDLLSKLQGKFLYVRGNHDNKACLKALEESGKLIAPVTYVKEIQIGKHHVVLSHHPFQVWFGCTYGTWNIFSHCCGHCSEEGKKMDVSVDAIAKKSLGYAPVSYEIVRGILDSRKIKPKEVYD